MTRRRRTRGGREPRPIDDSLKAVTAGFGSRGRAIDLNDRWAKAVGEAIAAHAQPERLEAGRLTVVVDDPCLGHGIALPLQPDSGRAER